MATIKESRNVRAFLDMLAFSEGTKGKGDDGYNKVVDGLNSPEYFSDYANHPNILVTVNSKGLKSTAAGRYQFLSRYWEHYKNELSLPDFGPLSQDKWALQLIRERCAFGDIVRGDIEKAISKCRSVWASLPGAGYGQPEHSVDMLIAKYILFGGKLNAN